MAWSKAGVEVWVQCRARWLGGGVCGWWRVRGARPFIMDRIPAP